MAKQKYSLVGVNGNVFTLIGYTARALRKEGFENLENEMITKATNGDYYNAIRVCDSYVEMCNEHAK